MATPFDPGYGQEPFRTLVQEVPDETVFPTKDFRTEWGPVFHRGRLDGTVALIEPAMILIFGALVGFLALAMLQAIYGINLNAF